MAFTKFDQVFSARMPLKMTTKSMVAQESPPALFSSWAALGEPRPVASAPGINGAGLSYTGAQGEIPITNSDGGKDLKLVGITGTNRVAGTHLLCDRLWHNSGLNVTTITEQVMTPVAIPARDINGAALGEGVWAALEVDTAATNAAAIANCTIRFTDSAGVAGRVGTPITPIPVTANAATLVVFGSVGLVGGVRSIEGITLGTSLLTGAIRLVLFRPILMFPALSVSGHAANCGQDALAMCAPTIPPGAVLFMVYNNASVAATTHSFNMSFAEA